MKNRAIRVAIVMLGGLLGASALTPAASWADTLVNELNSLLVSHPQIEVGRENVAVAEEGINRAFSEFLPKARLDGSHGYEHINSPGTRTTGNGKPNSRAATQATVTITQTVFSGFRNETALDGAKAQKSVAEAQLEGGNQAVISEAITTYLEVLRNIRLVKLAQATEANIVRQLDLEDERVKRGSGITVDVLQAKSRLQIAKERRVAFQGTLKDSLSRYEQVFGTAPVVKDMVMPTAPIALVPESVDDAIKAALAEHPSIKAALGQVAVVDQARGGAKSAFWPQISLVGTANYEEDFNAVIGTRRDYKAKVQVNWELFNGFATHAAAAQASHQYLSAIDTANFTRRKVTEEVRLAWQALETSRERVSLLQNAVNIAAEVFDARRKLLEAGKETAINVLDAENGVFGADINLFTAQHDARVATYRLLAAMGRLTIPNVAAGSDAPPDDSGALMPVSPDGESQPVAGAPLDSVKTVSLGADDAVEPAPKPEAKKAAEAPKAKAKKTDVVANEKPKAKKVAAKAEPAPKKVEAEVAVADPAPIEAEPVILESEPEITAAVIEPAASGAEEDPSFSRSWPFE